MDDDSKPAPPLSREAKDRIAEAFEALGGVQGLCRWVEEDDNRKTFYASIYPRLVPVQLTPLEDEDDPCLVTVRFV